MLKDKLKSIILIILIIVSFIQIGILWDYQGHGFPISFLSAFSAINSGVGAGGVEKLEQDVFEPYRIIVSAGLDEPHWILNKGTETQNDFNELWEEGTYYLKCIFNSENIQSISSTTSKDSIKEWEDLAARKGIIYEFKTTLKPNLISYFLNVPNEPSGDMDGMYKMLISPWDSLNFNSFSVYIFDGNFKLHKYVISSANGNAGRDKYDELLDKYYKLTENEELRSYGVIKETRKTFQYPAKQDIPIIKDGSKFEPFQVLNVTLPVPMFTKNGQKTSEIEKKFDTILGSGKDSYDITTDTKGKVSIKNVNNAYSVYPDGVLEYRNLSGITYEERLDESKAIKTALEFIDKVKLLPANVNIYLSGIQELKDTIKLTFDYQLDGVPINVKYDAAAEGREFLKNAITIEVNSKRVVNCWWILRSFEPAKEKKQFAANFVDVMDSIFQEYSWLKNDKSFSLKDAAVGYEINYNTINTRLEPSWFVYTENGGYYSVKMASKKGE